MCYSSLEWNLFAVNHKIGRNVCVEDFISNFLLVAFFPGFEDSGFSCLWRPLHQNRIQRVNIPASIHMSFRRINILVRAANRVQRNILQHQQFLESYPELSDSIRIPSSVTFAVIPPFDEAVKLLHQFGKGGSPDHCSLPVAENECLWPSV